MAQSDGQSVIVSGRIVWTVGDLFKGKVKVDDRTKQRVIDQKTGEEVVEYGFGLAIPKQHAGSSQAEIENLAKFWQAMQSEVAQLFPNGTPQDFSWKFKDGDTAVDKSGTPYSNREGYKGHIVVAMTTRIPIKFFFLQNGNNVQVDKGIKNGDYVQVAVSLKAHIPQGQGKPGIYVNPNMVRFLGYGTEIINTASGDDVFGIDAPTMVMGSSTPIGNAGAAMPSMGMPGAAPQGMPGMGMPQQQQMHQQAPATPQGMPGMGMPNPNAQAQNAQGAVNGYPTQGMVHGNPMQGTGFPQGNAQMGAFPGNNGGMPFPR